MQPRRAHQPARHADVRVIKGARAGADVFRIAGEDLRWHVQGGGHDDEGVHGVGTLLPYYGLERSARQIGVPDPAAWLTIIGSLRARARTPSGQR